MEHIHFRKFDVFRYTTKICKHKMYNLCKYFSSFIHTLLGTIIFHSRVYWWKILTISGRPKVSCKCEDQNNEDINFKVKYKCTYFFFYIPIKPATRTSSNDDLHLQSSAIVSWIGYNITLYIIQKSVTYLQSLSSRLTIAHSWWTGTCANPAPKLVCEGEGWACKVVLVPAGPGFLALFVSGQSWGGHLG